MSGADDLARLTVTIDKANELFLSEEPKMVDVGGGVMRPTNAKVLADLATQMNGAQIYTSVALGLSSTAAGSYFSVPSPESAEYLVLYQNNAGVAKEVDRYPNAFAVGAVSVKTDMNKETLARLTGVPIVMGIPCEPGTILGTNGGALPSSTRVRSSVAIYLRAGDVISSKAGFQFSVFYYASADYSQFISTDGAWHSAVTVSRDGYLRISNRRTDDSPSITVERELSWISFMYTAQKLSEEAIPPVSGTLLKPGTLPYNTLQTATKLIQSTPIVQGGISHITGEEQPHGINMRTGYVKVSKGDTLELKDPMYLYSPFWYSSPEASGFVSADGKWHAETMEAPSDGYVRVTTKRVDNTPVGLTTMTWLAFTFSTGRLITDSGELAEKVVGVNNLMPEVLALIEGESEARWEGKVWLTLGDSITARLWYQPILAPMLGLSYVGYGLSGSTLARKSPADTTAMCTRFTSMQPVGDLITVWGGVNDFGYTYGSMGGTDLGAMGDTGPDTVYGALDVIIRGLLSKYPGKKLAFFITTPVSDSMGMRSKNAKGFYLWEYCDAVRRMCEHYSIPYLDLYKISGINNLNTNIFTFNANETVADGLHPNKRAFEFMKHRMADFLRSV